MSVPASRNTAAKWLIVAAVVAALVFAASRGAFGFLTLESVQARQSQLESLYAENPLGTAAGFALIYVLVAALSLPGATVLTLVGGALFGVALGTLIVSVVSTVGATCAFLASRFLLRGWVERRFGGRLERINAGLEREGAFYLFTLRLVPAFPFFLVNLLMGLTRVRLATFFGVSQLGMLPGTIVYVNAGTQLARIHSLRDVASPSLVASFALLGIFPLIAKRLLDAWKSGRELRRYPRPRAFDYNFIVIGGGSAGLVASYIGAAVKARVALIEKDRMGGDCLNTGCVPSKALLRSARFLADSRRAGEFGMRSAAADYDFSAVMERVRRVVTKVAPHDSVERYRGLGVDCIQGKAEIIDPYTVRVDGRTLTARNLILATGARPKVPAIPGLRETRHWTSDTIWNLRERPRRLLVLGGGAIGSELAQAFRRLDCEVTLVEAGPRLLAKEDPDASALVAERFVREGMRVLTGHRAERIETSGDTRALVCTHGDTPDGSHGTQTLRIEFDEILVALGREARVTGFGLEKLGVKLTGQGAIASDEFLRTNFANIYVCGDVSGHYQFTHMAAHEAWFAAVNALFSPWKRFKADYRVVPWTTFTEPEVARVGLSETEAAERGIAVEVTRYDLSDLDRAITEDEDHGFVKVLTAPGKDQILGALIVGAHAGDLLAEFVLAMKHGIGLNKILGTIHVYPTFAEANKYVAGNWKKAHAPAGALRILGKFHAWRRGGGR